MWPAPRRDGDGAAIEQKTAAAIFLSMGSSRYGLAGCRCFLGLTGRVIGPPQRANEAECLGSAAPLDGSGRLRWSDCRELSFSCGFPSPQVHPVRASSLSRAAYCATADARRQGAQLFVSPFARPSLHPSPETTPHQVCGAAPFLFLFPLCETGRPNPNLSLFRI
jgi:hypothetical protein